MASASPDALRESLRGADFSIVLRQGRFFRGKCSSVTLRANDAAQSRLGLIVPKRIFPRAVDRNRLKRILREWFRSSHDQLQGKDCIVRITLPVLGHVMENELRAELWSLTAISG